MTNAAITILGWLVFFSIVGYISILVAKEIINVICTRASVYQRTKQYKRLIERNNAEINIEALRNILRTRDELSKTDDAVLDWDLFDWVHYFKNNTK